MTVYDAFAGILSAMSEHLHPLFYVMAPYWALISTALILSPITMIIPQYLKGTLTCPRRKDIEDVWTIHGKKYNLRPFFKQHPGGSWVLTAARGSDCTGLFESYHIFIDHDVLLKMLIPFQIKEKEEPTKLKEESPAPVVYCDDFYAELKQMVRDHFKGQSRADRKMTWPRLGMYAASWMLMWFSIYWMNTCEGSCMWVIPTVMMCASYLSSGVMHDASHNALVKKPWVNRACVHAAFPFGVNTSGWIIQHVMSHHIYTNDEGDVDLFHFDPVITLSEHGKNTLPILIHLLRIFFFSSTAILHLCLVVPYGLLFGHLDPAHGHAVYDRVKAIEGHRAEFRRGMILELGAVFLYGVICCQNMGVVKFACYNFSIYTLCGWYFILFTQVSHLQDSCFIQDKEELSFAKKQVLTSMDFAPDSAFWGHAIGGLNTQAIHHCFPGVSAMHLRDMYPKFRKVCKKHGVPVKECTSLSKLFWGFVELSN